MTVSSQTPYSSQAANGVTTSFPFAYKVRKDSDLVVSLVDASGAEIAQTLGVHYTVSGVGAGSGGTVDFLTAPADGLTVKTRRSTVLARSTDYQSNGDLLAAILNADVDAVWLALQELLAGSQTPGNVLRTPVGDNVSVLPTKSNRVNRLLGFNVTTGQPEVSTFTMSQLATAIASGYAGATISTIALTGAAGDGIADDTAAIAAARTVAELSGWELVFPPGVYKVTSGFSFTSPYKTHWRAAGDVKILFAPATQDEALFELAHSTSHCTFEGFRCEPATPGWGHGVHISGYPIVSIPNWKNTFTRCRFDSFKVGVDLTTDGSTTDGTQMDFASESGFFHCKFKNCRTGIYSRNQQAYNTTFYQTDFENDDVGEQYPIIIDETGCGINIHGGSIIGKGRLYTWKRPAGSTAIFEQSILNLTDVRVETRGGHIGQIFYQDPSGNYLGVNNVIINAVNLTILGFSQTLDLLHYAGRVKAKFVNLEATSATLKVRQFPVNGVTAGTAAGAQSVVEVSGNNNVEFVEDLTATYGATDRRFAGAVSIAGGGINNSGAYTTAADGFLTLVSPGVERSPYGLSVAHVRRLVWNDPNETFGWKSVKAILPKGARPINLIFFKEPLRFTDAVRIKLWLVKDNAAWAVPGAFNPATDTIALVADTGSTVNKAGFFTVPVQLAANVLGNRMEAGYGTSWTEGRIYIESDQASSTVFVGGMVGVEYM